MATIREAMGNLYKGLQAHHEAEAADHEGLGQDCEDLSSCMKGAGASGAEKSYNSMSKRHREAAARHRTTAGEYAEMTKALASEDLTKSDLDRDAIRPDGIMRRATTTAPNITGVPRAGAPAMNAKPPVPVQFEKMVAIEEG